MINDAWRPTIDSDDRDDAAGARKAFFSDVLGLKLVEDGWFALVYTAGGTRLHIQKVKEFSPLPFTSIGWTVADIAATVAALAQKGIKFERFDGMKQDAAGIWTTPDDGKVCWFKDPTATLCR